MPNVRRRSAWERADIALVAVAILAAVVEVARAPRWTADDAYIVARYADHLAHHGVLAFNLEGPRVEGFTSPLFALLAVAASLLGLNSVHVMTAAGVAAYVGSGLLLPGLARELRAPAPAGGVVAFLYLQLPEHVVHATSGLETEAYLAAELACALAFARGLRVRRWRALIATCLVASLLRPEGIALSAVLLALAAWRERADRARFAATAKTILAGWVIPMSALLVLRIALFHALLPNSYYAKRGAANGLHLSDLVALADRSAVAVVVASAGIAILSRFLAGRSERVSLRWKAITSAAVAIVFIHSAAYAHSVLIMNFARRFAMHTVPWLAILALGVVTLGVAGLRRLRRDLPTRTTLLALVGATAFASCAIKNAAAREDTTRWVKGYQEGVLTKYIPVARYLLDHFAADTRLAVYPDAGVVPYRTDFTTIDFGRLNDAWLAREAPSPEGIAQYFYENMPDALVVAQDAPGRLWDDGADAIVRSPRFTQEYALAFETLDSNGAGLLVYKRSP